MFTNIDDFLPFLSRYIILVISIKYLLIYFLIIICRQHGENENYHVTIISGLRTRSIHYRRRHVCLRNLYSILHTLGPRFDQRVRHIVFQLHV